MREFPNFLTGDNVNSKNELLEDEVYDAIQEETMRL